MIRFVKFLLFFIIFQTLLAVLTQTFGIFYFWVILAANIVLILVMFITLGNKLFFGCWQPPLCLRHKWTKACKKFIASLSKIDWVLLLVISISFLCLFQVHYNYTGKFSMVEDQLFQYHEVKNMQYVYPYFSDEWYAVSLVKESINNHSLPLKNPFDGTFFMDPEMFFHSFLAGIMLLLGFDPITQYTIFSVFFNTLLIVLAYLFLRFCNLPKFVSAISALSILYIVSTSNLPGIWNLIPVTMGIIFSLIEFCFLSQNKWKLGLLAFLFIFLFYPPLIIFSGVGLLTYFLRFQEVKEKLPEILKFSLIFITISAVAIIILMLSPAAKILKYIFSNLFYDSFTGSFIPQFNFYSIIPWWAIAFAFLGAYFIYKNKKWLFFQLILGVGLWAIYMFSVHRLIIGFERTVFFTSILACIVSGFGMEEAKKYLGSKFKNIGMFLKYAEVCTLILFVLFLPFYTQSEGWRNLILSNSKIKADSIPMAPANNYLTSEDLRIFKNIKQKRFFSIPWKGTVIGITTGNYPIITKGGTITMYSENPVIYQQFMGFDCGNKSQFAKEKNLDYIYSSAFSCPNFQEIDKSSAEGLTLYKFNQ